MISDYCHGDKEEYSADYTQYVHQRGYHMMKVVDYGHLLETVGFTNVDAQDMTSTFIDILNTEVKRFVNQKSDFLKLFSPQDFDYIVEGWNAKVRRCSAGDQGWGLFLAEKSM